MQTGIYYTSFGFPLRNRERFNLIASSGFDAVSFWWGKTYIEIDGPKEELPDLARKAGLFVENVHSDFEGAGLLWTDEAGGEEILKRYMKDVEDCHRFNIPAMVMHLTQGNNPPPPGEQGISRIKRLVDLAEKLNVNIALENLRKPEYLGYVYERINSDKLKFCYDSGHENCFSKKGDLLDTYGDKLIALHLHDNDGISDEHRLPGEGTIDWNDLARKIKKLNYRGQISLEVINSSSGKYAKTSMEQFLAKAIQKAKWMTNLISEAG